QRSNNKLTGSRMDTPPAMRLVRRRPRRVAPPEPSGVLLYIAPAHVLRLRNGVLKGQRDRERDWPLVITLTWRVVPCCQPTPCSARRTRPTWSVRRAGISVGQCEGLQGSRGARVPDDYADVLVTAGAYVADGSAALGHSVLPAQFAGSSVERPKPAIGTANENKAAGCDQSFPVLAVRRAFVGPHEARVRDVPGRERRAAPHACARGRDESERGPGM